MVSPPAAIAAVVGTATAAAAVMRERSFFEGVMPLETRPAACGDAHQGGGPPHRSEHAAVHRAAGADLGRAAVEQAAAEAPVGGAVPDLRERLVAEAAERRAVRPHDHA